MQGKEKLPAPQWGLQLLTEAAAGEKAVCWPFSSLGALKLKSMMSESSLPFFHLLFFPN